MDPDAALDQIRALIAVITGTEDYLTQAQQLDLAETFDGLDAWMSRNGFPPGDWRATSERGYTLDGLAGEPDTRRTPPPPGGAAVYRHPDVALINAAIDAYNEGNDSVEPWHGKVGRSE